MTSRFRQIADDIVDGERPSRVIWRSRDGREVEIGEMGHGHLLNTIRFLERSTDGYPDHALYGELVGEAQRRGLSLPKWCRECHTHDCIPHIVGRIFDFGE